MSEHERQGTGFDSGAAGHERQGRASAPRRQPPFSFVDGSIRMLDRRSTFLSKAVLWNKAGVRLGVTKVTDEVDFIEYGGGIFRRGEWMETEIDFGAHWLFEQCETPVTFVTNKLDP